MAEVMKSPITETRPSLSSDPATGVFSFAALSRAQAFQRPFEIFFQAIGT
jgi:hypothetical protein